MRSQRGFCMQLAPPHESKGLEKLLFLRAGGAPARKNRKQKKIKSKNRNPNTRSCRHHPPHDRYRRRCTPRGHCRRGRRRIHRPHASPAPDAAATPSHCPSPLPPTARSKRGATASARSEPGLGAGRRRPSPPSIIARTPATAPELPPP